MLGPFIVARMVLLHLRMLIILDIELLETINQAEMPTGIPLVFELEDGEITGRYFLGGE